MERITTGVLELDSMLKGGYPRGSMVLVTGPVGVGKSTLAKQFLYDGAIKGNKVVYVNTCESPESVQAVLESFEWDTQVFLMKCHILDLYSWRLGAKGEYVVPPSSLSNVSITLFRLLDKNEVTAEKWPRLVVDILSDIFLAAGAEPTITFLQSLKARLAARKITSLVILEKDVLDQRSSAVIESLCDGTVSMTLAGEKRMLSVPRMLATPGILRTVPFGIARGIELKVARAFE